MTFKGAKATIKEITDKIHVRYVLEGSVRKAGNNLRPEQRFMALIEKMGLSEYQKHK
jgi:TolB-like protein